MFRETIGLRGEIVNPASGETGRDISPTAPELVHARLAYTGSDKSGDSYVVWTLDGPTGEDYPGAVRLTQAEDPQKEGIEDIGQMSEDVDGASSADSEEPQNTVRFLLGIAGKVFDWLRQNSLTNGHGNQELEPMSMPTPENPNYPPFPTPEPTPTPAPVPWLPTPTPTPAPAPWQPTPTPTPAPVPWQPTPTPTPAPVPWQPTPTPTPAPAPFLPTPAPPPPFLPAPAPEPTPDPEPLPPTYTGPSTALRLQGNIDENGIVLRTLQGSFLEGHLWIRVEPGTKALDRRGNPLEWINVERVDELPPLPDGWRAAIAFELTPDGALFSPGVLLNLSYDYIALSRAAEKGDLHLVYYNPHTGQWVKLNQSINLSMSAVETQLDHFTLLALFEKTPSGMPVSWWLIGGILAASLIVGAIIMSVVRMKVEEEPEEYAGEGPG